MTEQKPDYMQIAQAEGWRETVAEAARLLQAWVDEDGGCECEGPHSCGLPNLARCIDDLRAMLAAPAAPAPSTADMEDAYKLGLRDGRDAAMQEIDIATGGDGEYRYCTDHDPDRHCPDADAMKARIVERWQAAPAPVANVVTSAEAVAIICDGWDIRFIGIEPIARIVRKHGLEIGTKLYTRPAADVQADAERYRWLRSPNQDVGLVLDKRVGYVPISDDGRTGGYHIYEYRAGEELDAAIDAARAQGGAA